MSYRDHPRGRRRRVKLVDPLPSILQYRFLIQGALVSHLAGVDGWRDVEQERPRHESGAAGALIGELRQHAPECFEDARIVEHATNGRVGGHIRTQAATELDVRKHEGTHKFMILARDHHVLHIAAAMRE